MAKVEVSLCLATHNDDINFDYINNILMIKPTYTRYKHEYPLQSIKLGIATNEWILCIKENNCLSISEQIDKIRVLFDDKESLIEKVCVEYNFHTTFVVIIKMEEGNLPEITISPENIKFLSKINAELDFDIY